jgi:hypothetical protein
MESSATWGAGSSTHPTPILGAEAKSQLEQALRDIPVDEKASYLEAVRVVPHLVNTESNPILFLRVDDGNAQKAAARLCMYWTKRAQLFGERAFLSLRDCSGSGALDEAAVKILDMGAAVQLPDDTKGSPVFCSDSSRLADGLKTPGKVRLQVLFHVLNKIAESNPMGQSRGVILLRVVTEAAFDRTKVGQVIAILDQAIPLKIKVFRMLCIPPPGAKRMFEQTALPVNQKFYSEVWGDRAKVHVAASAVELVRKLKTKGLRKSGLPLSCGGRWKYETWQAGLVRKDPPSRSTSAEVDKQEPVGRSPPSVSDNERKPKALDNGASKGNDANLRANRDRPEPSMNVASQTKLPAPCNDAIATSSPGRWRELDVLAVAAKDTRIKDRIERKRKNDIVYAQQKRMREKAGIEKLQDVCLELNTSNTSLRGENNKFEQMLKDAVAMVATEEARALAAHTAAIQHDSRIATSDELISGLLQQQQHTRQNQTIASTTAASLEGTKAIFGQSQLEQEAQTVPRVNMGCLESVLTGLLSQLQQPNLEVQSYQGLQRGIIQEARASATHNVSVERESRASALDELLARHLLQQQQQQQQRHTWQNQTMASSTTASLEGMLARLNEMEQERHVEIAPLANRVGLQNVFAGFLSQLQRPNLERQPNQGFQVRHSTRLGTGISYPKGRIISQIPLDPRQQQQSQASILLANLDINTLQSLMARAPVLATQHANTASHLQEPSLDLSQLMSLGFTLEQALECYRSLPP